jgi:hypothetical protein
MVIIWISGVHLELDYHWVIKTLRWKILDDTYIIERCILIFWNQKAKLTFLFHLVWIQI